MTLAKELKNLKLEQDYQLAQDYQRKFEVLNSAMIRRLKNTLSHSSSIAKENSRSSPHLIEIHKILTDISDNDSTINHQEKISEELTELWEIAASIVDNYPDILSNKKDILDFLFPEGSLNTLELLYKHKTDSYHFNNFVSKIVESYTSQQPDKITILELGGGIGATTEAVIQKLKKTQQNTRYIFTDISPAFLALAKQKFDQENILEYRSIDINSDFSNLFITEKPDIIIATNVVHLATDIPHTLEEIHKSLSDNGVVIINEGTKKNIFSTIVFGPTKQWHTNNNLEYKIPGSPLIDSETWTHLLEKTGFNETVSLNKTYQRENTAQDIIVSQK